MDAMANRSRLAIEMLRTCQYEQHSDPPSSEPPGNAETGRSAYASPKSKQKTCYCAEIGGKVGRYTAILCFHNWGGGVTGSPKYAEQRY